MKSVWGWLWWDKSKDILGIKLLSDCFKLDFLMAGRVINTKKSYTRVWGRRKEEKTWKEWWVITPYEQKLFSGSIITLLHPSLVDIQGRFLWHFSYFLDHRRRVDTNAQMSFPRKCCGCKNHCKEFIRMVFQYNQLSVRSWVTGKLLRGSQPATTFARVFIFN